jgi:hypothetical protein
MQNDSQRQNAALNPEQLAEIVQEVTVCIDPGRPLKYLEIAKHVADHEQEHHGASNRHDNLLAVRRLPKRYRSNMRENPSGAH